MKIRYEIDLTERSEGESNPAPNVRRVERSDRIALANLMLEAYRGTIDFEDESLTDAIDEIDSFFSDSPVLEHSFVALQSANLVSAVLVMLLEGQPFISYVITDPTAKRQGFATTVTAAALDAIQAAGHERVSLYITKGNLASERMFRSLGAEPQTG